MRQENTMDDNMTTMSETASCARFSDLVAFLYREATDVEARDFQTHLDACAICRVELSTFGEVRSSIGTWRDEALNPTTLTASNVGAQRHAVRAATTRSGLSAIREFFALSPLWLRGVTAFAGVLFVTLLVVSVLHFFERSQTSVVQQAPVPGVMKSETTPDAKSKTGYAADVRPSEGVPGAIRASTPGPANARDTRIAIRTKPGRRVRTPVLTDEERSQLSELLIAAKDDEESVPRLYDLLSESN